MQRISTTLSFILCLIVFGNAQSEPKLDTEKIKAIDVSTPAELPQEPVVAREKSDVQEEHLKGKVLSVTGESQDLSGTRNNNDRHFSYIENFNEKGNLVKKISFDYMGNPSDITVYGYLNGARVSKINTVRYSYDPPPAMLPKGSNSDQKPRDLRITYSYGYKYVAGNLAEMQMYYNDGTPGMRYTYIVKGSSLEKLAFDDKGSLNQKYNFKLDKDGYELEDLRIDLTPQRYYGDKKFVYKYDSFDRMGNWTKRTASQIVVINGKEVVKPSFVHYRTVTYFK